MTEQVGAHKLSRWEKTKRATAVVMLAGAAGLAGWGVVQLVDGIAFSSPDANAYPSHSTSDPRFLRDAAAQSQEIADGVAHVAEGTALGLGTLLVDNLGLRAVAALRRIEEEFKSALKPGEMH